MCEQDRREGVRDNLPKENCKIKRILPYNIHNLLTDVTLISDTDTVGGGLSMSGNIDKEIIK